MEKKVKNKVNHQKLVSSVIILVIAIIAIIGYIVYNKNLGQSNNKSKEIREELSLTDPVVMNLYGYVTVDHLYVEFRSSSTVTNVVLEDYDKLGSMLQINGITQFHDCNVEKANSIVVGTSKCLEKEQVVKQINQIFGPSNGYDDITDIGYLNTQEGCKVIKYDAAIEKYVLWEDDSCNQEENTTIHSKLVKAEKSEDSIILTEKIFYQQLGSVVYKNSIWEEVISTTYEESKEDEYFNKGSTVTYTFRLGEDSRYYFESSQLTDE